MEVDGFLWSLDLGRFSFHSGSYYREIGWRKIGGLCSDPLSPRRRQKQDCRSWWAVVSLSPRADVVTAVGDLHFFCPDSINSIRLLGAGSLTWWRQWRCLSTHKSGEREGHPGFASRMAGCLSLLTEAAQGPWVFLWICSALAT